jgi:hypothetical protein
VCGTRFLRSEREKQMARPDPAVHGVLQFGEGASDRSLRLIAKGKLPRASLSLAAMSRRICGPAGRDRLADIAYRQAKRLQNIGRKGIPYSAHT